MYSAQHWQRPWRWEWPVSRESITFTAYGTPTDDLPDPVLRAVEGLLDQMSSMQARIDELEREQGELREMRERAFDVLDRVEGGEPQSETAERGSQPPD